MQEESGEPVCSNNGGGGAEWLCPLCQQGQPDRNSLSQHLTNQHNVLPTCLDKLLDIAVQKRRASGEDEDTDLQKAEDAGTFEDLKNGEDSSSQPCPPDTDSDAAQKPVNKAMEEEGGGTAEQERGGTRPEPEQEGRPPKQPKAATNVETQDAGDKRTDKNAAAGEINARPFKCNACLETFPTKTALSVHYTSASHIQRMTTGSSKQQGGDNEHHPSVPVLSRPYISNKPYQCATCRVSYNHAITLESHMKSVLHQTRSRNAGNATSSAAAAAASSGGSGSGVPPHTAAVTAVTTTNCAAPGSLLVAAKDGEQIQASAAGPSLLSSPVASAQAVSAFLTLLTSTPNSLSHSLLPSVFAAGAAPGTAGSQLVPQPQMLMPLILNGLQAQNQQNPDGQPGQLLPHCVPLLGLNAAQQALLAQRLSSLQNQWPAVGIQAATTHACLEERKEGVKGEGEWVKQEESDTVQEKSSVKREGTDSWTAESCKMERDEEEDSKEFAQGLKTESKTLKVAKVGDAGKADGDSTTDQLGLDGVDKAASLNLSPLATDKSFRNNNLSPSASVPSNSSLSPVNLNLTLSPDSTPQKSQAGTSPCGSLGTPKSSPYKNALISPERRSTRGRHVSPGPPVLSDFQSEVLWAFFESRSEADAASPPREDCEALGREVGLSEDEVRRWLSHARHTKERQRAAGMERRQGVAGYTRHSRGLDNDYDEEESSLMIVEEEEEDSAEASSSQAMDLSSSRWKKREKEVGRESLGDSCLTSDSDNEEVYASIVSDEESQNGSMREAPDSPVKDELPKQQPVVVDKSLGGGKVLRSTTVFLSDAEDEYEEEEGGGGQRARRQKRKREYECEEVEIKKERQDPDVDLELEAQGDPPNTLPLPINHPGLPSSILHSLPLSLSLGAFPTQFLSPYVLSLPPSMVGDGSKVPAFPNPPNITRFPDPLIAQTLSHGQASRYLSNGGDCESALDLSMGKNSNSKSASSSSSSSSLADMTSLQKGRLLDGLGLRPTSKGLIVVQVKPEPGTTTAPSNSSGLFNCNNMTKSSIYMRAAEKMNATLLEREKDKEKDKDKDQRKSKGKRYRDMRRSRTIIRAEQLDILYGCYFKDPNPGKHEFEQISEWVHLPKKVVQIWFQNMRARERKGEVRFISDGTLAAVGKPLIKFTWPLSKPIFSNKQSTNNTGSITATPIVRTLIKTEKDPVKDMVKPEVVKSLNKVPIKPKEVVPSTAVSLMSSNVSAVPKIKQETTSNLTMVKIAPKINAPILPAPSKDPLPIAPRPTLKRKLEEESEEEKTDEEKDGEKDAVAPAPPMPMVPGAINRMVPKLPTTPINNKSPAAAAVSQKQNGLNYWTHKGSFKINTLSREQLALPAHTPPRTIPPPPTPSIAPVSPNAPGPVKAPPAPAPAPATPALVKSSPTESSFLHHSTSRRPRTHLSCPQLSILQSCYETCAHPNAMECEAIGTELGLPLKVVQIWFQNTRAKEKRWRLQQEKVSPLSGEKVDMSSGSYLQYSALRANRPILPKPVQLTVLEPTAPAVAGQPAPKETLTGRCKACSVTFESRAAARAHVFSPRHLATLRTTNFGQPATLVNKNGNGSSGAGAVSQVTPSSGGEAVAVESPPPPPPPPPSTTTATSTS